MNDGRPVSPELWRCVGPFADDHSALNDIQRALDGMPLEAKAAALALAASPLPEAKRILEKRPEATAITRRELTWRTFDGELENVH